MAKDILSVCGLLKFAIKYPEQLHGLPKFIDPF